MQKRRHVACGVFTGCLWYDRKHFRKRDHADSRYHPRRKDYLAKRGIIPRDIGIIPRSFLLHAYLTSGTVRCRAAPSENEVPGDWWQCHPTSKPHPVITDALLAKKDS